MKFRKKIGIIGFIISICVLGYFGYISIEDNSDTPEPDSSNSTPSNYPSNVTESDKSLVDISYASDTLVFISPNNSNVDSIYISPRTREDLYRISGSSTASIELSEGSEYGVVVESNSIKYRVGTIQPRN